MLDEQVQNQPIDMDIDVGPRPVPIHQNEKIIFCIDLDLSMEEQFMIGDKPNDTRINRTKQVLKWFIAQKSKWNPDHEFAVIILGEKAVWHVDFTTDIVLLEHAVDELYTMGNFPSFNTASLFELIMEKVDMSEDVGPTVRAIMIYTRSDVLPSMPNQEVLDALHASGRFYFDCIYIHNKASEVVGNIKPQQIYDRLTEMESARSPGFFYELTRVLKKFSGAMGELLAHPAIRSGQDDVFFNMPTPPSLRRNQEMVEQSSPQKQASSSPNAKRTDIPVNYKSPETTGLSPSSTFFSGAAVGATVLPATTTGTNNGNVGIGTPRTPPLPPFSRSAAGSPSPFSSQVGSRSGSVTGMRVPPSGPGSSGGAATGGGSGASTGQGGNSGAGTGMDDAILI
ncbi:Component of the BRCA1-A complex [Linnemannia zychae]|nr:Component of the BRCA1-A complex [Linnemannia zychae]